MTNKLAGLALAAVLVGAAALPAFAQSGSWTVDSGHSDARLAVEGIINGTTQSISLGGAGVNGTLRLDRSDLTKSTLQFNVYPEVSAPNSETPDAANSPYTLLSFRSESASPTADGQLKVTGRLTVTRVIREAVLDANEAYSGPVYVSRVVTQATREESFVLTIPASDPDEASANAEIEVSTLVKINREDFPELVNAVLSTAWPIKAHDKTCEQSPNASEDYAGTLCTGSVVTLPSDTRTATSISEDYPGDGADSAEAGNLLTVALHLQLAPEGAQLSSKIGQ
jgi:polyisoprenoid-binding protein YceI